MAKIKAAVIGGGASGLLCAIIAARKGVDVTIFEEKEKLGKKICATGNGKCNFTNSKLDLARYNSDNKGFWEKAFKKFTVADTLSFFNEIGITPLLRDEYYYPNSEEADSVRKALELTCLSEGVKVINEKVISVKRENGFTVNGKSFDKVVLCMGSPAGYKDEKVFTGYDIVRSLGVKVTDVSPALVRLTSPDKQLKTLSGVRTVATISLFIDDRFITKDTGEILFNDKVISGIPAMQISRFVSKEKSGSKYVTLDLLPDINIKDLNDKLRERFSLNRTNEDCLNGLLNHKLNYCLLLRSGLEPVSLKHPSEKEVLKLAKSIKEFRFEISGTNLFDMCQVVAGGVDTRYVDPETMGSKDIPGLYFAGEILDVDGPCGGYNLQWAWTSGYIAGEAASCL